MTGHWTAAGAAMTGHWTRAYGFGAARLRLTAEALRPEADVALVEGLSTDEWRPGRSVPAMTGGALLCTALLLLLLADRSDPPPLEVVLLQPTAEPVAPVRGRVRSNARRNRSRHRCAYRRC